MNIETQSTLEKSARSHIGQLTGTKSLASLHSISTESSHSTKKQSLKYCYVTNNWLAKILEDWEIPLDERIAELKTQRRALLRANLPTGDITLAIKKLSKLHDPEQLIMNHAPYQLFATINCTKPYPEKDIFDYTEHLLKRVNDKIHGKGWMRNDTGMQTYLVFENKSKLLGDQSTEDRGVLDTLPHWHMVLRPSKAGEKLNCVQICEAFEFVTSQDRFEIETTSLDKYGLLLRDKYGDLEREPVFDSSDIHVKPIYSEQDNKNTARYMTKNLWRSEVSNDQYGPGLYHFNNHGLIKLY